MLVLYIYIVEMKWINFIFLSCTVLVPHITCVDEVKSEVHTADSHVIDNGQVSSTSIQDHETKDNKKSQSCINQDLSSDENTRDISEQNLLHDQLKKLENSNNDKENSLMREEKTDLENPISKEDYTVLNIDEPSVKIETTDSKPQISLDSENNIDVDPAMKINEEKRDLISKAEYNENSQSDENDGGKSQKKQRYFPLLYTFGSMFTSFLAEFGEVSGSSDTASTNSSDAIIKNFTYGDGLSQNSNATSNSTDQGKKTRFQCSLHLKNSTTELNGTAAVKIINSTELLEILNFSKNQKSSASPCVLVMFYTKWCHFSARAAPEYNALARAFPQLDVLAVDTSHFSYLNAKFGTVAVPNIMLFHSRSAVRFNHTMRDLDHFIQFVSNNTGLEATSSVAVLPEDFEGPLSSKVVQGRDWLLWLAWAFIFVVSVYGFFFSLYGQAIMARLRVLWLEHQHIE